MNFPRFKIFQKFSLFQRRWDLFSLDPETDPRLKNETPREFKTLVL